MISQSGITGLKQLDSNGINELISGNQLTGFISDGPFQGPVVQTFYKDGKYNLSSENKKYTSNEFVQLIKSWSEIYPIASIEDALDENDWKGWTKLQKKIGNKIQIVGDDLTVTNLSRLQRAINEKSMNSILIKLNP